jgi:hypothetical protein
MECGMTDATPTFAIVGAVNHGKSSVVSTLAENDQVRISSQPGETVECQRFELLDLFAFYDTPGFQNAIEALAELAPAAQAREPLAVFREFIARHQGDDAFESERLLFQPVVEGAGIVYVVDGSEPLLEIHAAEMEILRLTGQPRLAIINRTGADDHVQDWKRRLGLHFNAVREFNAHHATFADRLELLETLAGIEQSWKPKLTRAVAIFREEWDRRLGECAEIIVELLADALTHREVMGADTESKSRREVLGGELKERFVKNVSEREARAQRAIIKLFGHSRVRAEPAGGQLFDAALFSDDTWRAFGLDERQLAAVSGLVGTAIGAKGGAVIDASLGGASVLLGTLIGGAVGGVTGLAGALVAGKRRPALEVAVPGESRWLPKKLRFGGSALSVGPYAAVNFPWILLDRALGTFCYVINRAHARQDEATIRSARLQTAMDAAGLSSARWSDGPRKRCEEFFRMIRRGRMSSEERRELRELIRVRLAEVSAAKLPTALD